MQKRLKNTLEGGFHCILAEIAITKRKALIGGYHNIATRNNRAREYSCI